MKKFLAVVLMVFLLVGCFPVYAESIDLSAMTQEELIAIIEAAENELKKFQTTVGVGAVLYEDENIKITLNGDFEFTFGIFGIPVIIENYSSMNIIVSTDNCSINGWDVLAASQSVTANGKSKAVLHFPNAVTSAEINTPEDVKEIKCNIRYFNSDTLGSSFESDQVVWNF